MDREDLHDILVDCLGSEYVYFQPPESIQLTYPCIIYKRKYQDIRHANCLPYDKRMQYIIQIIDPDPDSTIIDKISSLPTAKFETHFTKDNLNHDIYNIYY